MYKRIFAAFALVLSAAPALAADFALSSADFADGGRLAEAQVLDGFGCHGGNQAPRLSWTAPPAGTQSFAVTAYDPDAPTGSGWWHWVVFDIPASARSLGGAAPLPEGAKQGRTDFGGQGYGGACPPPGPAHRYVFTVFALKTARLPAGAEASGAMAGFMIRANTLAEASVTARYGR